MSRIKGSKRNLEEEILAYITKSIKEGLPPTVREICSALSISSTSTVHKYIKILVDKGYISTRDNLNRSITLNVDSPNPFMDKIPIVGNVAAGYPILAVENISDYIAYNHPKYDIKELFALKIKGESMVEAAILDGDIVVCHKTNVANNGEIIVALIDDEATVKTFYREFGHIRLQPQNLYFEPIIVEEENLKVLGRVVGVVRNYN